ncbi:hemerythrin domain-containing protein [Nocardioides sp. dk4132]|uniref:hemerythrin domain-containing protein n=1 Tax=unclassified Nocardioides TaxID=2615069 RepID=UPI001296D5F6|nr:MULTISPECIES: hemerythrin domain-containing protein [unclassified Nocardioides]MQW75580.1 hemerythrin domain-containing protein [Nocardioides sp. dk4132]QGA08486.1 hemerythrin domain-containing protein [Nocardioides sp. dk884]
MTSIADQDIDQLGGPLSILVRQRRDHEHLDVLLHQLELARPGADEDRVLGRIARLVFPHAFAEESVLWPELRRRLPDGEALTLQVEREHQEVNELWTALEQLPPVGTARRDVLKRLGDVLREDVRDEEDELLPRLQEVTSVPRLRALGVAWEAVRRTAPTRPHPVVSRRPPGNALAALPLTVLDRSRDGLDAVARRVPQLHPAATRASGALAGAAGRVERAGVLRRGEDPSTRVE